MSDTNVERTTVYDDVFRTMLERTPKLMIYLINEIFSENYNNSEKIVLLQNELLTEGKKIVTDSYLKIKEKYYHIECQSNLDGSMAIRMMEYDFMIALRNAEKNGYHYHMKYPNSSVLYLRHNSRTPDHITVNVELSDGTEFSYHTPIIKVQDYSLKEIFDKKLLAFLPYYILRYEKQLNAMEQDAEKRKEFVKVYEDLFRKIRILCHEELTEYETSKINEYINEVFTWVTREQPNIQKEVREMCGKILRTEIDDVYDDGKVEGIQEGKREMALNMYQSGMSIESIAQFAQLSVDTIKNWLVGSTTPVR